MNNKGIKQTKMYVILAIILILALIVIFYLVENNKDYKSAKPLTTSSTSVSSTKSTESTENNNSTSGKSENPISANLVATPFSSPLSDIIYGYEFREDYKVSITYNNTIFDFNCNNYNETEHVCLEGSGLMRYNDLVIPLYAYSGEDSNVLNFAEDYYIDMKDDYIFLTNNHVGVSAGKTSIYNNAGKLVGEVKNVVTGYMLNGKKYNVLYPNYENQELTFYYFTNGVIKIGYVDVKDTKVISEIETISGATLN